MAQIEVLLSGAIGTLIQVDPAFCTFSVAAPMGSHLSTELGALTVNANYFDEPSLTAIGMMVQDGQPLPDLIPLPEDKPRTGLVLMGGTAQFTEPLPGTRAQEILDSGEWSNATVIQAGPRLLRDGQIVQGDEENFAGSGALRRTRHVAIGITSPGKVLFLYVEDNTPRELAHLLAGHGAVDAMKVDGGHAAFLRHRQIHHGAGNPFTALVVAPSAG
jgi:exopolysaccharide biosynthesis protein